MRDRDIRDEPDTDIDILIRHSKCIPRQFIAIRVNDVISDQLFAECRGFEMISVRRMKFQFYRLSFVRKRASDFGSDLHIAGAILDRKNDSVGFLSVCIISKCAGRKKADHKDHAQQ